MIFSNDLNTFRSPGLCCGDWMDKIQPLVHLTNKTAGLDDSSSCSNRFNNAAQLMLSLTCQEFPKDRDS